jgi:hypothetical protein
MCSLPRKKPLKISEALMVLYDLSGLIRNLAAFSNIRTPETVLVNIVRLAI